MKQYLYLTLNIVSFIIPFLFSFYSKANFSRKWKYVIPSMLLTAAFFIVWDIIFTRMGIWGFNPKYLSGIYLFNLPVEEVLFFFCIPYACVFTYFALNHLVEKDHFLPYHEVISSVLIILLLLIGVHYMDKWYTGITFILTGLLLAVLMLKLRSRFMGRFYFAFLFILIPFFIVNGILTGTFIDEPVVWYNNEENIGLRLGTIPVEDVVYSLLMILMPIAIAEKLEERSADKQRLARA